MLTAAMLKPMEKEAVPTIRDLYPRFDDKDLKEAEDNFDRYLALVLQIFDRLESETHPQADQLISGTGTLGCTAPQSEASS